MAGLSPMMQQYMQIKEQYKDEVLFFRLGDFYEMFFDDAIRVSKELELTLTGRDCGLPERAPMCGIPYHSFEGYVQKLLAKGYHVAICEQLTDPSASKGIVERGIVRVYTPGTVLESGMLEEGKNNFLCSVTTGSKSIAVCFADVSTGHLYVSTVSGSDRQGKLLDQMSKFEPSEVLLCENSQKAYTALLENKDKLGIQTLKMMPNMHALEQNVSRIAAQFGGEIPKDELQVQALATLLFYIDATQQKGTGRIREIDYFDTERYMGLDIAAKRNLELVQNMTRGEKKGSLLWVVDKTKTAMGKRLIRSFVERPLTDRLTVENRLDAVQELVDSVVTREELRVQLDSVSDLERLMGRILYGNVSPKELKALSYTIGVLPAIKDLLSDC
ncbi:MAG: DNA mismatch repair protein MutS, partial [Oscillospiraceae bacterium]|nr:DNA mismatch repair protein MutS [Oscillospiraceae bacterium]